ncbi:hypothetical protein [Ferroglobus sp.]|uniref:hypothetical protein n=1 Tax=Ferroglobus sp. TaxID=2614230 RepID=UPI0025C3037D|nr:hypothetical protein [Ferroglobus sp.]
MKVCVVYSPKLKDDLLIGPCLKISGFERAIREYKVEILSPSDSFEEFMIYHERRLVEKVKKLPFSEAVFESAKCVVKASEAIEECDLVILATAGTGHQAERDKFRGYSFLNDVAVLRELLERKGYRVAIIDTDAHHSALGGNYYCICLERGCVCYKDRTEFVRAFKVVCQSVEDFDAVIWYLGLDIFEGEYMGDGIGVEDLREMIRSFLTINSKKIVILAGGSKEEVAEEVTREILESSLID